MKDVNYIRVICACFEPEPEEVTYTLESYPPYGKTTDVYSHTYCKKCKGIIYPKPETHDQTTSN